jgi:hypothetical protein
LTFGDKFQFLWKLQLDMSQCPEMSKATNRVALTHQVLSGKSATS